jgi:hypothetical protein
MPPATSTFPEVVGLDDVGSWVALWSRRPPAMLAVADQVPVVGS